MEIKKGIPVSRGIAANEGRFMDAVALRNELRRDNPECISCDLAEIASYFDLANQADSALAYFEQWFNTTGGNDARWMPVALRRLGEIHESKGNTAQAIDFYNQFVELWDTADPNLQPLVADIRERIARLVQEQR